MKFSNSSGKLDYFKDLYYTPYDIEEIPNIENEISYTTDNFMTIKNFIKLSKIRRLHYEDLNCSSILL